MTATDLFLGVIAVATLAMAIAQVGVILVAGRLARRVDRLADQIENELKPLFGHANAIARDAARAASLAAAQVERADQLFADVVQKIEQTLAMVQSSILGPIREGRALLEALRAVISVIRGFRQRPRPGRGEDDDALFI